MALEDEIRELSEKVDGLSIIVAYLLKEELIGEKVSLEFRGEWVEGIVSAVSWRGITVKFDKPVPSRYGTEEPTTKGTLSLHQVIEGIQQRSLK